MSERDLSYAAWTRRRRDEAARRARLDDGLPPYRRQRLRRTAEAEFLRGVGTPDSLIGPVADDDEVAAQWAELREFARRLRERAGGPGRPGPPEQVA